MKFAFVIAALFAASAIAAPCTRRHVDDDVTDMPAMDESNGMDTTPTNMDTSMDDTPVDDTNDTDTSFDSSSPSTSVASTPDTQDEMKTSTDRGDSDNSQTAVINNDSPDKGGKGSLFGLDVS
jgi:hypothetical protein